MLVTSDPLLWETLLRHPLGARRGSAPRELIDFIGRHHAATGKAAVARPARPDAALDQELDAALAGLPGAVLRHLEPCLLGRPLEYRLLRDGVPATATAASYWRSPHGDARAALFDAMLDAPAY